MFELRRILKRGGTLIITVRCQKKLWAEDDGFVDHKMKKEPKKPEDKPKKIIFAGTSTN